MSRRITAALAAAAAVAALGSSAGCSAPVATPLTIALTASAAEPAPSAAVLDRFATAHARAAVQPGDGTVAVVVPGTAEPVRVDLTPLRNADEVEQDPEQAEQKVQTALPALRAVFDAAAPGLDGLDALGLYRRAVQTTPTGGTVVLVTSGVQTLDPVDLRTLRWDFDPDRVVADLAARGLLPDASGRNVSLLGLGITAGSQPDLPLPAATKIVALWHGICARSGAVSCTVLTDDLPRHPGASRRPVPVVPVDVTPTRCQGSVVLPEAVTFPKNEAVLTTAADAVLRPIAENLWHCPAGRVATFTGHTAQVPSGDDGIPLSRRRAVAIRDRLAELGVPSTVLGAVRGLGCTAPIVANMPGGVFSETLARINRRVEITITLEER